MIYLFPSLISIIQGYFLLTVLCPVTKRPAMPLFIFWGSLLGMATTALLAASSLIFFDTLHPVYAIGINIAATTGLFFWARHRNIPPPFARGNWDKLDLIGLHLIIVGHVPVLLHAASHSGNSNSSTPMLVLPWVHAWAWCFSHTHDHTVILVTALRLSLIMSGILFFGAKALCRKPPSTLIVLWIAPILLITPLVSVWSENLLWIAWLSSAALALIFYNMRRRG